MGEVITKEKAQKLMQIKGNVRGLALKSHKDFIIKEKGEEGLEKLEDFMQKLGYLVKYKDISLMKFYPVGLEIIELLAIKQVFSFGDEKFVEIGRFGSKTSLILRIFMKYFVSLKVMLNQASRIWEKYYTIGDLKVIEVDEEQKYVVLRIEDFDLHPLHCLHVGGYCTSVIKMVVKREVHYKETKCVHRGDGYHEFLFEW